MHARLVWDRSQVDGPRHDWRSRSDAQTGVAVNGPDTPAPDEAQKSLAPTTRPSLAGRTRSAGTGVIRALEKGEPIHR